MVTVLGYVHQPGPVDLPADATVQMALRAAGGVAVGAQLDKLQVRRGDRVREFNYKAYLDSGDPALLPVLQPLDELFVPASPLTGNVQVDFDAATLTAAGDASEEAQAIKVFGEVHRPGTFAYRDGASVIDMLMRAGGVTRYAGIEQIRVISRGKPRPFNMREYLDTGDETLLPRLDAGDTVFVPQVIEGVRAGARTVYIMGEVFKPGAYEALEGTSFLDIFANAGGPTRYAETRQIRILHADGRTEPFDLQAYTEGLTTATLPQISPGDAILVPEKTDINEKSWLKVTPNRAVRIIGSVHRPNRYEWSDEMNLMDLIAHAGGPRQDADLAHLQIITSDADGRSRTLVYDLQQHFDDAGSAPPLPPIQAGDTVLLPELPQDPNDNRSQWVMQSAERSIYVMGQVKAPGRYAFNRGLGFLDIISASQGPTGNADLRNVRVTHRDGARAWNERVNLELYFETGDETLLPRVLPEDVIFIPARDREWISISKESTVRVLGAVAAPGRYRFDDTMTVLDLLAEAGGPTADALQRKIIVINKAGAQTHSTRFDLVAFAKSGDFTALPVLRAGDMVYVPGQSQSGWNTFTRAVGDMVSVLSLVRLAGGL